MWLQPFDIPKNSCLLGARERGSESSVTLAKARLRFEVTELGLGQPVRELWAGGPNPNPAIDHLDDAIATARQFEVVRDQQENSCRCRN